MPTYSSVSGCVYEIVEAGGFGCCWEGDLIDTNIQLHFICKVYIRGPETVIFLSYLIDITKNIHSCENMILRYQHLGTDWNH